MISRGDVVVWGAAFVAIWWMADWLSMRQRGEPLPLRRAPLRVLAQAVRKLRRNKSFLLALLCLWLLGATVGAMQMYFYRLQAIRTPTSAVPMIGRIGPLSDAVPELLGRELPGALPRLADVPLGIWGGVLLAVLLALGIVRMLMDPPREIGAAAVRRLRWPAVLLAAFVGAHVGVSMLGRGFVESMSYGAGPPPARTVIFTVFSVVVMPALLAPAVVLLWRLVLEIMDAGVWSFRSSVQVLSRTWLPAAFALIAANALLPIAVFMPPGRHGSVPGGLYVLVGVLLAFVPWVMVDRQVGLVEALRESWRLLRLRPMDVIAFGLRFTLLFALLGAIVGLVEPPASMHWHVWYSPLLSVVRNLLVLLQVMTVAGLYVHLRDEQADGRAVKQ